MPIVPAIRFLLPQCAIEQPRVDSGGVHRNS
jgi:hypothetical protein